VSRKVGEYPDGVEGDAQFDERDQASDFRGEPYQAVAVEMQPGFGGLMVRV